MGLVEFGSVWLVLLDLVGFGWGWMRLAELGFWMWVALVGMG